MLLSSEKIHVLEFKIRQYYNNQKSKCMASFALVKLCNISTPDKILWKEIWQEPAHFSGATYHYCLR